MLSFRLSDLTLFLPNYHSIAKEGLERAVTNSKTTVIALTATPEIVKKEFNTAIYELPVSEDVRHYETKSSSTGTYCQQ